MTSISNWLRRPRSVGVTLCLGASSLFLWFLLNCFQVDIAFSRQVLRMAVDFRQWDPRWPAAPWLVGLCGLLLPYLRTRFGSPSNEQIAVVTRRLHQIVFVTLGLMALKLVSLWNLAGLAAPYLGLLWSPDATWALVLLYLVFPTLLPASIDTRRGEEDPTGRATNGAGSPGARPNHPRRALLLFAGSALLYGSYALYICQVTMLHGDETHYLLVTQSLLHDGDIDLTDNLATEDIAEFHVMGVEPHRAPASPEGKIYSIHPVGLSVLMVPAYWLGLELWGNPRLPCALLMALMTAACVALLYLWLVRLRVAGYAALMAVAMAATTAPLGLYSTQLFPEIPALLISLVTLVALAHWQVNGGRYQSVGGDRGEPLALGGLSLLLGLMPFLHPRYIAVAGALGSLVVFQSWHSPRRTACLALVGAGVALALGGLLTFNLFFSGDLLGPFRPGNAWAEDALQLSTWLISLPGHWLLDDRGILNSSPVFLLCPLGAAVLALRGDRRLLVVVGLYAATAAVNGLHPLWTFGFGLPGRFLLSSLPALVLCIALCLGLLRSAAAWFATLLALCASWDGVIRCLGLPETGYAGRFLSMRDLADYYPWAVHFFTAKQESFPAGDLGFWFLLLACLFALLIVPRFADFPLRRAVLIGVAALLPALWGQVGPVKSRAPVTVSPFNRFLSADGFTTEGVAIRYDLTDSFWYFSTTGSQLESGGYLADEEYHPPGILTSYKMRLLKPGVYTVSVLGLQADRAIDTPSGYLILAHRRTVPAISDWEVRHTRPLQARDNAVKNSVRIYVDRPALGYAFLAFTGYGELGTGGMRVDYTSKHVRFGFPEIEQSFVQEPIASGESLRMAAEWRGLSKGRYRIRLAMDGLPLASLFERKPEPLAMAVFAGPVATSASATSLRQQSDEWYGRDHSHLTLVKRAGFTVPLVERTEPPWWTLVPFVGDHAYELSFGLDEPQDVRFLLEYSGPYALSVADVSLHRSEFTP